MRKIIVATGVSMLGTLMLAGPAFAGEVPPAPAPVAGIGVGAVVLLGLGYRYLRRRIDG
jgi:drug/metabolite transporter (DMT)-like permease